ncbi:hypothetical protein [uncultured Paracoccus sp.]|uniref:hypothetical protein n=1 Tax=uncultured Paracoccus sp. TaxID=189685 RepID=UPI002620415A|nr:hypothetical protein [uncultured Paracoccus sp.]
MKKAVLLRHEDFARRFKTACDENPNVPELNHGRLGWIAKNLGEKGFETTPETVRKWTVGQSRPHPHAKMVALAELLRVDLDWLSNGTSPGVTKKEARVRREVADGAVNFIAGLVQMSGAHPAFPAEGDEFARSNQIDLYAIIRGIQHAFHIVTGEVVGDDVEFLIPAHPTNAIIIGLVPKGGLSYEIVWIDGDDAEEKGVRRGDLTAITLGSVAHKPVETFAQKF